MSYWELWRNKHRFGIGHEASHCSVAETFFRMNRFQEKDSFILPEEIIACGSEIKNTKVSGVNICPRVQL